MDPATQAYFHAVESHFIARRGRPLLLSPEDVARVAAWHRDGIPIHSVLEGIDLHFERLVRRGKQPRRAVTLAYVEDDVLEAWAGAKRRRIGKAVAVGEATAVPAALATSDEHGALVAGLLKAAASARAMPGGELAAVALSTAADKLVKKAALFDVQSSEHDDQRAEDHLRRLERSLLDALREAAGAGLAVDVAAVEAELAGKRAVLGEATHERVSRQLVDKRLRDRWSVPRLSLFYT